MHYLWPYNFVLTISNDSTWKAGCAGGGLVSVNIAM